MSSIIQLLPDHVANQIAAGEVVQRPASVIKELLENAVDAKATEIKVIIKDAGKTLIQVIDNGIGMSVTDSRLCFERHATSKIRIAEDLFALHTKGFRGEALASIAAIAHIEMKTRQEDEELGTCIVIEGSKFISQDVAVLPKGTSFSVKNLFFNIPARRNFLKSDTVEYRHITDEFERVALAHPSIGFTLYHNGSEMYNLPAINLRQRIVNVFGGRTNEKLVPVNEITEIVQINGFIGKPEFAKKGRGEQFFFVNNRFIKSGYLHHAIMAAYDGLLKDGCQPAYFIYLEVLPNTIDINIHPTKTEIKFDDEHALYTILRSAVKHALGQFSVAPVLDFDRDAGLDIPYSYEERQALLPNIEVSGAYNPFDLQEQDNKTDFKQQHHYRKPEIKHGWESLYTGTMASQEDIAHINLEPDDLVSSLFDDSTVNHDVYKTYQLHKKYIVSPIKSGLVIIDQKRAHQRILYEQFLNSIITDRANSQQLLFPLILHYTVTEFEILAQIRPSLENTGFIFTSFTPNSVVISGLPVNVAESEVSILFEEIISDIQMDVPDTGFNLNDRIAKAMSRSLAVKTGTALSDKEQEHMVNTLFGCKEPDVSPLNKPVFITLSVEDIDKRFIV